MPLQGEKKEEILIQLQDKQNYLANTTISHLFSIDSERFANFSLKFEDFLLDYSKVKIDKEAFSLLIDAIEESGLLESRSAMFRGDAINITEDRAALHTALRRQDKTPIFVNNNDVMPEIFAMRERVCSFAEKVRSGEIIGITGEIFTDIVSIGIGGSDLGPLMATVALAPYHDGPKIHFVSNVDGAHLYDTLKNLVAERTLFIIASKTFTTTETLTNANSARKWCEERLGFDAISSHFVAISSAIAKVKEFGISENRAFSFADWVGGRYSLWAAIALPLIIAIGERNFSYFLKGGEIMDRHFETAPSNENLPVILAAIGIWHRVFCKYTTRAVIPYEQRLFKFPSYLQQLDMESNGKSVTIDGNPVSCPTGAVVWGEVGTNGQHAFFQLLHQGTDIVPVEFLTGAYGHEIGMENHHQLLVANCLAQSQALMRGRSIEEAKGNPHRVFSGDRPSTTLLYKKLDPTTLGKLISLYEHRVFVESLFFGINPFDQWGVELGKELAFKLAKPLENGKEIESLDSSTYGLVQAVHALRSGSLSP